jgi:hypothetical protein
MLKLISNEVEEFVCAADRDSDNPTVFGVVRMGKGQLDRLTIQFERGVRKEGGKTWESFRADRFQRAIWKASVKWIKNLKRADGTVAELIDAPSELVALWDALPGEPASEVIGYVQGISTLDEDEEGNSGSVPDSDVSGDTTASSGARTSATTADSTA